MIKILIADDHAVVRSGIKMMVNSQEDMEVIAEAVDGDDAIAKALQYKPDLVIMDLNMPPGKNGIIATQQLKAIAPHMHIIVLTMHDDNEYIFRVLQAGASGYILKSSEDMELIKAIRTVWRGEAYLYPKASRSLLESYLDNSENKRLVENLQKLTIAEETIVSLVAAGRTNADIAEELELDIHLVELHRSKIAEKLNLKTREDLVKYARAEGLLDC